MDDIITFDFTLWKLFLYFPPTAKRHIMPSAKERGSKRLLLTYKKMEEQETWH